MRSFREGDTPIPGYRLTTFLGRGGFGEVWKATAPGGFDVALKIISLSGKPGQKELRALEVVKALRHPNLVPVTAFWLLDEQGEVLPDPAASVPDMPVEPVTGKIQETMMVPMDTLSDQGETPTGRPVELVIAMGLADKSLFDRLQECQREGLPGIPDDELIRYMDDSARAIDYLNSPTHTVAAGEPLSVQHCDIKPHNILITSGAAQVCDFGLARVMGDVKHTSATAGTIAYAAPECVIDGEPSNTTDQYSLAVSYLELKTGSLPYESETWLEVISAVQKGELHLDNLPPAEREVMRKATARNPVDRFASAVDMVAALKKAMDSPETVTQATLGPTSGSAKSTSGPPIAALAGGGILALLLLVGGIVWMTSGSNTVVDKGGTGETNGGNGKKDPTDKDKDKEKEPIEKGGEKVEPPQPTNLELAEKAAANADYGKAVELFTKALDESKDDPAILFARAKSYLAMDQVDLAIADLNRVEELDPSDKRGFRKQPEFAEAFVRRGLLAISDEQYKLAETDFVYVLNDLKQKSSPAAFGLGLCRLARDEFDMAIESFDTAIEFEKLDPARYQQAPERADAFAGRANKAYEADQLAMAEKDAQAALEIQADNGLANLVRGTCFMRSQSWQEALPFLDRAVEAYKEKEFALPYSRRGYVHERLQKYEEAADDYSFAIHIEKNPDDYVRRAFSFLELMKYDLALNDLDIALKANPENADGYYYRGEVYRETSKFDQAIEDYGQAIKYKPDMMQPYVTRAAIQEAMGKYSDAVAGLSEALNVASIPMAPFLVRRAEIHKAAEKPKLAAIDEQLAILAAQASNNPQDAKSRCELALRLAASPHDVVRNGARAEQLARAACELTANKDPECLSALAAALAELGKYDEAVVQQQNAINKSNAEMAAQFEKRLESFQNKKPFRLPEDTGQ